MEELKAATRTTGAEQRLKNAESNFAKETSSWQAGPVSSKYKQRKRERHLKVKANIYKADRHYISMKYNAATSGRGRNC